MTLIRRQLAVFAGFQADLDASIIVGPFTLTRRIHVRVVATICAAPRNRLNHIIGRILNKLHLALNAARVGARNKSGRHQAVDIHRRHQRTERH